MPWPIAMGVVTFWRVREVLAIEVCPAYPYEEHRDTIAPPPDLWQRRLRGV